MGDESAAPGDAPLHESPLKVSAGRSDHPSIQASIHPSKHPSIHPSTLGHVQVEQVGEEAEKRTRGDRRRPCLGLERPGKAWNSLEQPGEGFPRSRRCPPPTTTKLPPMFWKSAAASSDIFNVRSVLWCLELLQTGLLTGSEPAPADLFPAPFITLRLHLRSLSGARRSRGSDLVKEEKLDRGRERGRPQRWRTEARRRGEGK